MKTEFEKMLSGEPYDASFNPELSALRDVCQERCYDYNRLRPSQSEERERLIREILGAAGERCNILAPFYCDYGCNIRVGDDFFANFGLTILDEALVTFGNHVFIGPHCGFYTACHPHDETQRNAGMEYARPITVGNSVWFGAQVCVLPGVTIGNNVIIGAGSVVVRDLPDNVIAVGNPARIVREL